MSDTPTAEQLKWASGFVGMDLGGDDAAQPAVPTSSVNGHAGGGSKADKHKPHKPTMEEQVATMQDQLRGHTKMDIARTRRRAIAKAVQ